MPNFIVTAYRHWCELLRERKFVVSLSIGVLFVLVALYLNQIASLYTETVPALSVGDLILDNIPTVNLTFFYQTGIWIIMSVIIGYPLFFAPEKAPFTAKTFAAFTLIRSFFIILTHLGAPEPFYSIPQGYDQNAVVRFFYLNDLFFSAHTGIPFLGALLFWENKWLRSALLVASVVMGMTVLLMHVHYSIDVFGAYFITYSIFVVSDKIFNKLNIHFRRITEQAEKEERLLRRMFRKIRHS